MIRRVQRIFAALLLSLLLAAPAFACFGCDGRFPPGVNLRLMRMRMKVSSETYRAPVPKTPAKKAASKEKPVKKNVKAESSEKKK